MGTPRVRRTRSYSKAVQHHAQRQPLGELAGDPPPDIPPWGAACRQGLGDQRRLADAGFALDPDQRSLTAAEGLDTSTDDREFLPAAHPLRWRVNGPHASNVCPRTGGCLGCGLRPPEFEHGNGADSGSLACVLGKARVAPRLLSVDAVAFGTGQFADGHLVRLGSAFDTAVTGGGQVAVPVRVGGCSTLGCEDVDGVRLGIVREVHHRVDVLPPAGAAAVMHQDQRGALEVPAHPALVRPELRDGLSVPVERLAHVELLSFTIPGMRWYQVTEGRATVC